MHFEGPNLADGKRKLCVSLVTWPGFEPGACIYFTALTTKSSQLVEFMVKESHNRLMTCPGFEPGRAYISCSLN